MSKHAKEIETYHAIALEHPTRVESAAGLFVTKNSIQNE